MVDIVKQDMAHIWAISGDVVAPDNAKIAEGWGVEVVPRQWLNFLQYRTDTNIAYMLQKGIPEWDSTTEYLANKSFVTSAGLVYKCLITNTDKLPLTNPTNWARAFSDYSVASAALGSLTPTANAIPYFTSSSSASTFPSTAYGRGVLNLASTATALTYFGAQASSSNLTALSSVSAGTNVLPYFNGTSTMTGTTLTAFARTLLDDMDAAAARATLSAAESAETQTALNGKQPLNAKLTSLASLVLSVNDILIADSANSLSKLATGVVGRDLLACGLAVSARDILELTKPQAASSDAATDFNDLVSPGWQPKIYRDTSPNGPPAAEGGGVAYWYVHVNVYSTSLLQTAYPYGSGTSRGRIAWRSLYQGSWTTWSYSATTADITALNLNVAASAPVTGSGNTVMSVSPVLTGTPTAPTAALGTNTTQLATTAFVLQNSTSNPSGTILAYAGSVVPSGYLLANGAAVSRTTYSQLFAAIGTTYGAGDGSTTFNIPELRGEFLRGLDNGRGVDTSRTLGSAQIFQYTSHAHTFTGTAYAGHTHTGTTAADSHTHTVSGSTNSAGDHSHNITTSTGPLTSSLATGPTNASGYRVSLGNPANEQTMITNTTGAHTHTVTGSTSADSHSHTFTTATGGGFTPAGAISASGGTTNSSETRPRNVAVQFLIKF